MILNVCREVLFFLKYGERVAIFRLVQEKELCVMLQMVNSFWLYLFIVYWEGKEKCEMIWQNKVFYIDSGLFIFESLVRKGFFWIVK